MQKWIDNNDTLMYSTHTEGKPVNADRFIRTLKSKDKSKWFRCWQITNSFYRL